MPADPSDPEYWRFRAEEVRSVTENLIENSEVKEILRRIADDYERIAKFTEKSHRIASEQLLKSKQ
jgi:hypothetical protein